MSCGCKKLARGITGLVKVVVGVDRADNDDIIHRQSVCAECEFGSQQRNARGVPLKCNKCGCYVPAKTRLKSESCPDGQWGHHRSVRNTMLRGSQKV